MIGIALLPLFSVNLQPSRSLPSVSISYTMRGATGELIDSEVTTPIEGTLSTINGIKKLTSRTGKGYGRVSLQMEKGSDMDAIRFEVATLMRQLYDKLPEDCSLPVVSVNMPDEENRIETLLSYQVSGQGSKNDLVALLEREFAPVLSGVEGVHEVSVKGAERRRLALSYDQELLEEYGLSATEISSAIRNQQFARQQLGFTGTSGKKEQFPVVLSSGDKDSFSIHNIRIQTGKGEIPLNKLVDAEYTTRKPYSYYRINGLNKFENRKLSIQNNQLLVDGTIQDHYVIQKNYFLMIGDNRHGSTDSRYWGFVPEDHLIGKATCVLASKGESSKGTDDIRVERFFKTID